MKYRSMEVPEHMKDNAVYKGLVVPYTTLIVDDKPQFKMINNERVWECKRDGLCSLCGKPLDYWKAFMVTEKEAESRIIFENPNHEDCLKYAFNVCPWLFYSKATYADISSGQLNGIDVVSSHPDRELSNQRPPKFGVYITNRYENVMRGQYRVCKVGKAKRLEWIEGK